MLKVRTAQARGTKEIKGTKGTKETKETKETKVAAVAVLEPDRLAWRSMPTECSVCTRWPIPAATCCEHALLTLAPR
jgi:hypothetical protein